MIQLMKFSFENVKNNFKRGTFFRNVAILAGGTAVAQAISVVAAPLLTRTYLPEAFGTVSIFTSIVSVLVVIISLRFELALPLPEDNEIAINLLTVSITLVFGISILIGLLTFVLSNLLAVWTNLPLFKLYAWYLPLWVFCAGIFQVLNYWAIRKKTYKFIAWATLFQVITQVFLQIIFGLMHFGTLGLLLGQVGGQVSGFGTLFFLLIVRDNIDFKKVSLSKMYNSAYSYRKFPLLSTGSALINSIGLQFPLLILAAFYGTKVTGWLSLGQRVIGIPMALLGQTTAQVYLGEASRFAHKDLSSLRELFTKTAKRLFLIGGGPIIILGLIGPWLFSFVFGNTWLEAGKYIQLLVFMFLAQFVTVPLSQTLIIIERQDIQLLWDIGRLLLVTGGLVVTKIMRWPAYMAVGVYSLLMLVAYIVLLFLSNYFVKEKCNQAGLGK